MTTAVLQNWLSAQSSAQLAGSLYFLGGSLDSSEIGAEVSEAEAIALRTMAVDAYEAGKADPAAFQMRVAETLSRVAARFSSAPNFVSEQAMTPQVQSELKGSLAFENLQRQLKDRVAQLDLDGATKLFFASGIFSMEVSRHLVAELCKPRHKSVDLFLRRLIRLVTDPEMRSYSELRIREDDSHDRTLLKFTKNVGWRITDLFGRLTILTQQEALASANGDLDEILSPNLQLELREIVATEEGMEENLSSASPFRDTSLLAPDFFPTTEGALMVLRTSVVRQEMKIASYPLLRRHIFSLMAGERYQDAAEMLMTLREPEILVKLFEDLRMLEGKRENGFANASAFYHDTASFTGLVLAAMPVRESAHLMRVIVQEGLGSPWLIRVMGAIRPDQLAGLAQSGDSLPLLSTILGTLIENKATRTRMKSLLAIALDSDAGEQSEPFIYEALDRLHDRYSAFVQPMRMIAENFETLFDEKQAARVSKVEAVGGIWGEAFGRFRRKTPQRPYLELPTLDLATRQEMMANLQEKLKFFFREDWVNDKKWPLLSSRILLTLSPAEVWSLLHFQKSDLSTISMTRPEILAHLLLAQEPDLVAAFFKAWGREFSEREDLGELGRVLTALWKISGEKGKRLVTAAVQEAMKDSEATEIFQKILREHGSDGELMWAQMEMYLELADGQHLGAEINPYGIFVTTGVLKPVDLEDKFRPKGIAEALKALKDLDTFGKVNVPSKEVVFSTGLSPIDAVHPMTNSEMVPAPELALSLSEEEQTLWRQRATDLLVQLKADEPEVVKYFAVRLESKDAVKSKEAFEVLDHLGPRAQKKLDEHVKHAARRREVQKLPYMGGGVRGLEVPLYETVEVPVSLQALLQKFPLTSRAVQSYIRKRIIEANAPYVKTFKKDGDMDRIAAGEVAAPSIIRELVNLGDEALIFLEPFAKGDKKIFTERIVKDRGGSFGESAAEEWKEINPTFLPLIQLAELIGTPAAHQILVDLYEQVKTQEETEIRGGYFSREHSSPQTPLRIILHAMARMEHKPGYTGPIAVEAHADFVSRYGNLNKAEVARECIGLLRMCVKVADGEVEDAEGIAKKIVEVWEKNNGSPRNLYLLFHGHVPLWNFILGNITSPHFYWQLLGNISNNPVGDVVRKTALNEDPNNLQRGIAVKTLFWCYRDVQTNAALVMPLGPTPTPDPALKILYDSGLAARYADPEDVRYFSIISLQQ